VLLAREERVILDMIDRLPKNINFLPVKVLGQIVCGNSLHLCLNHSSGLSNVCHWMEVSSFMFIDICLPFSRWVRKGDVKRKETLAVHSFWINSGR
jgi:hypothetical protein